MWGRNEDREGYDSRVVANRFIDHADEEGSNITILQLVKFVYLAHGWHLGAYHKPLIYHNIEAWPYGPLIRVVYDAFRPKSPKPPTAPVEKQKRYEEDLDEDAELIIGKVYSVYSKKPPYALSALTHKPGTPWHQAWQQGYQAQLSRKSIEDYYSNLLKKQEERPGNGN